MQHQIIIDKLECMASIGILPEEKINLQPLQASLQLEVNYADAARTEDLSKSVDYFELSQRISTFITSKHTDLLETLIYEIAALIFQHYPSVEALTIRLDKPQAVPSASSTALSLSATRAELLNH